MVNKHICLSIYLSVTHTFSLQLESSQMDFTRTLSRDISPSIDVHEILSRETIGIGTPDKKNK